MKCPKCQNEINDDNQYCPYCGHKIVRAKPKMSKEVREMRMAHISFIMNRVLNISAIVAIVFAIIGMFGPITSITNGYEVTDIGGLSWFSYSGWVLLNEGVISIGPFYTTFVLYILTFIAIIVFASLALHKAINSLRKREECRVIPHIILMSIIHSVYSAFIYCFYYEYNKLGEYYVESGSAWGETVFGVGIPLFTLALVVYLIMKAVISEEGSKKIVRTVFVLVCSLALMNMIASVFSVLGILNLNTGEMNAYGTLHYFDKISNMDSSLVSTILVGFFFGLIFMGLAIAYSIITIKNLVKKDKVDRKLTLQFGIAQAIIAFLILITAIVFSALLSNMVDYTGNIIHITGDLALLILSSLLVLGLSIAVFAMGELQPKDPNIIDVEVVDKTEEEA